MWIVSKKEGQRTMYIRLRNQALPEKNIIVFSDLNWESHLRSMTESEALELQENDVGTLRYERIKRYFQIALNENADLVLFAGDVSGDGFCGHGFHFAFISLLRLFEQRSIPCLFISGNHDPDEYYEIVKSWAANSKFCQEISGQQVSVLGLTIYGINYDCSKSKRALNKAVRAQEYAYDIVLAHSQTKRRIRHFDFDTRYIFTGHYDRKLCSHREKIFVALDNDSEEVSYALLKMDGCTPDEVSIKIRHTPKMTFGFTESADEMLRGKRSTVLTQNGQATFDLLKMENASDQSLSRDGDHFLYLKYLRGVNYASSLDTMYKINQDIPLDLSDLSLNQIHGLPITATYRISESMIEDYLGDVID